MILLFAATSVYAQQPQGSAKGAILTGIATDSIRGGFLRGASVFVSGTALSATTDSAGRFRIAGIPSGMRVMEVQHPLLDTLGIALTTVPKSFSDGDSSFVMVSVPSPETYAATTCAAEEVAKGPAVIVGTVSDAGSGQPSAGSNVSVTWTDYEVARNSVRRIPQWRIAAVTPKGDFRICGLPDDLIAGVVAFRNRDSTAAVEVDLTSHVGSVALTLPAERAGAAPVPATAFISGRVVDSQGKQVKGARVSIESDDAVAESNQDGAFTLRNLRPGTRRLTIRKIGFEPVERAVDVRPEGVTDVTFALGKSVATLKGIVVRATQDFGLARVGFTERKEKASGAFLGPKDIEDRNSPRLGRLLETVPMMKRAGCTRYYIDGFLQGPLQNPDEYLSGSELGAVEVYSTGFVPVEFFSVRADGSRCRTVVVWTKWKITRR